MPLYEFLKYSAGGTASFVLDIALIKILLLLGWNKDLAILVGFGLSTLMFSYFFHKFITFEAGDRPKTYARYVIAALVLFVLDIGGAILLSDLFLAMEPWPSPGFPGLRIDRDELILSGKVIAATGAGLLNFFFLRQWVFVKPATHRT